MTIDFTLEEVEGLRGILNQLKLTVPISEAVAGVKIPEPLNTIIGKLNVATAEQDEEK